MKYIGHRYYVLCRFVAVGIFLKFLIDFSIYPSHACHKAPRSFTKREKRQNITKILSWMSDKSKNNRKRLIYIQKS